MEKYPLLLSACQKDIIWGGVKLKQKYGKNSSAENIAESWELTIRPDGMNTILNGIYSGMKLCDYLGLKSDSEGNYDFPLLIKFIDAASDLSVQVHPQKTELWYIIEADDNAKLIMGCKENFCEENFRNSIKENKLGDLLNSIEVCAGEFYMIPSGLIHAIGAGILLAEIQQNSNVTYRVYDWGRGREIHTEAAIDTIKKLNVNGIFKNITECEYFNVVKYEISKTITLPPKTSFYHILCVGGEGFIENEVCNPGNSYFIPDSYGPLKITSDKKMTLIISYPK